MATSAQRAQAYVDALLNRTATQAEVNRVGTAYARNSGRYAEYQEATANGKAAILIACARAMVVGVVKATEAQEAAQAAANSAVLNVDADLAEAP